MREDHPAPVHRGQAADRLGLHPGVRGRARHQGERSARAQGGLHASGNNREWMKWSGEANDSCLGLRINHSICFRNWRCMENLPSEKPYSILEGRQ